MCDSPELLAALAKIERLLKEQSARRDYVDQGYSVSDTQGFPLDYKGYRYLYVFSGSALTFKIGNTATLAIAANTWTPLQFRAGHRIFTSGQATPVNVLIRATDDLFAILTASSVTQGTSPWTVSVSNANPNGQNTSVNSSPVVTASDDSNFVELLGDTDNLAGMKTDLDSIKAGAQGWIAATGTGTASQDDSLTFAQQVRKVLLYNASANPVPFEFDQTSTANSVPLQAGQYMILDDVLCTVVHVFPSALLPINTANGLYVKGWT